MFLVLHNDFSSAHIFKNMSPSEAAIYFVYSSLCLSINFYSTPLLIFMLVFFPFFSSSHFLFLISNLLIFSTYPTESSLKSFWND